jgi:formylglycine-generating enzyme required for sulfatase activity
MKIILKLKAAAVAAFFLAGGASAQAITIDTVTVGDIGNVSDTAGYGAVDYSYQIGTYEVTNTQYATFLNAVAATDTYSLYNGSMAGITQAGSSGSFSYTLNSGYENKAVNYVSFWSATRFANWLNNGQGSADTETGSYTLTSGGISAQSITRNGGANWVVASEDEWYKAAYYDPMKNDGAGGYWAFATRSDTITPADANYDASQADVGFGLSSAYGTFDQTGGLYEWNEGLVPVFESTFRSLRGGTYLNTDLFNISSSNRTFGSSDAFSSTIGFRVASLAPIPEPSTYALALGGVTLAVVMMRRRKARGTL